MSFVPRRYRLHLWIDPRSEIFRGWVKVWGKGKVVLDADRLKILSASSTYTYDGKKIVLDEEDYGKIEFEGRYWDDLLGPYKTKGAVVTQFEESYARRLFPCVDHPKFKAIFDVSLTIPRKYEAVFNTEPKEIRASGDRKYIRFEETPPMPTYILFIGVGRFNRLKKDRIGAYVLGDFLSDSIKAVEIAEESLNNLEKMLKVPYPLSKLDLISVPDFLFGAMENWGAVLYRESAMLYNDTMPTRLLYRVAEVVAHENVHQWFGNLVTPSSWKDIWLNESFATYLSHIIVSSVNLKEKFSNTVMDGLRRDSVPSTIPVELKKESESVITPNTSDIIYSKGASILKMLHDYLGELFEEALSDYLKTHAFSTASTLDFWKVVAKRWEGTTWFKKQWIERAGHPLIVVEDGQASIMTFSYFGAEEGEWKVPAVVEGQKMIIESGSEVNGWIKPGFFVVDYDTRPLVPKEDAWKYLNDLFELSIEGRKKISSFFKESRKLANPTLSYVSSLSRNGLILWRLRGETPEYNVFKQIIDKLKGEALSIAGRRLVELGDRATIEWGLELYERNVKGDLWEIALEAHFLNGGDLKKELKGMKHEGMERIVLEAAAATYDPEEFLEFVLKDVPKAKRIYPLRALIRNPKADLEKILDERIEELSTKLHRRHLQYVLIDWVPLSGMKPERVEEIMEGLNEKEVRSYVLELSKAYRRISS